MGRPQQDFHVHYQVCHEWICRQHPQTFCLTVLLSKCTVWYSNWEDQVDWFHMKKRVNCVLLCMQHWLLQNVLYFNTKLSMVDFNKKNRVNLGSLYMYTLHVIIHESADLDLCLTHTYLVLEWLYTYTFLEQPGNMIFNLLY